MARQGVDRHPTIVCAAQRYLDRLSAFHHIVLLRGYLYLRRARFRRDGHTPAQFCIVCPSRCCPSYVIVHHHVAFHQLGQRHREFPSV